MFFFVQNEKMMFFFVQNEKMMNYVLSLYPICNK